MNGLAGSSSRARAPSGRPSSTTTAAWQPSRRSHRSSPVGHPHVGVKNLEDALAEAAGKFDPDRRRAAHPRPGLRGRRANIRPVGCQLVLHSRAVGARRAQLIVVLIDDAGFGGPTRSGGGSAPEPDPGPADGPHVQPVPHDRRLLADPGRVLTGRTTIGWAWAASPNSRAPFPGYTGTRPQQLHGPAAHPEENGYITGGFGRVGT